MKTLYCPNRRIIYLAVISLTLLFASCKSNVNHSARFRSTKDIPGKTVVACVGSIQEEYTKKHFKTSPIMSVDGLADMPIALVANKADVAFIEKGMATKMMQGKNLAVLDSNYFKADIAFLINPKDKELGNQFNAYLKKIIEDGTFAKIQDKWENHLQTATMPKPTGNGSNGTLHYACSGMVPPHSMTKEGAPCGIEVEVVARFAYSCNKNFEVSLTNQPGIISSVAIGKVDMGGDAIVITAERAKKVMFSVPYTKAAFCAVVRKTDLAGVSGTSDSDTESLISSVKDSFYNNIIAEKRYLLLGKGLMCTAVISLFSAILGTILGSLLCLIRMRSGNVPTKAVTMLVDFLRGVPQVVLLMILFYLVFTSESASGVLVSIIGFTLVFAAYVSEMFRTTIENVDKGQWEAGYAMGFSKFKTFRFFVLPIVIQRVLPLYKGEFIAMVKSTAIVGYIAVQDLTKAGDLIRSSTFDPFFPLIIITVIYFLLIWLLTRLLLVVKIRTAPRRRLL